MHILFQFKKVLPFLLVINLVFFVSQLAHSQDLLDALDSQPASDSGSATGAQGDVANARAEVLALLKESMDAYGNLDLDAAKDSLETALGYAPEIDKSTLARVYVNYGVVWVGGYADNAKGQNHFIIAKCLDDTIQLDPLLSTPDIDMVFKMAQGQVNPDRCSAELSKIITVESSAATPAAPKVAPVVPPLVPPCGTHNNPQAQKQKTELPVYLQPDPSLAARLARIVVKFALNGGTSFSELPMRVAGAGFGTQVSCDEGQIRVYDPAVITYYIEGYDAQGNLICGHASAQGPFTVNMDPLSPPLSGLPGMPPPKECVPCAPWDKTCGNSAGAAGATCYSDEECASGFVCDQTGLCTKKDEKPKEPVGPSKFYSNLTVGTGFGIMSDNIKYSEVDGSKGSQSDYEIVNQKVIMSGAAWSGLPLRLAFGYNIKPNWAVEVSGRLDMASLWTAFSNPQNCYDAAGGDMSVINGQNVNDTSKANCSTFEGAPQEQFYWDEGDAKKSVAFTSDNHVVNKDSFETKNAWLINVRARYRFLINGGLQMSLFGGLGYGHILYQRKIADIDLDTIKDSISGTPGVFNIELGPSLTHYFNDHVGFVLEVPIDIMVGDGFGINFELAMGLSFGG